MGVRHEMGENAQFMIPFLSPSLHKEYDKDIKSNIFILEGTNHTRMRIPKDLAKTTCWFLLNSFFLDRYTLSLAFIHTHIYIYKHTHIQPYIHAYIHTTIHTHIQPYIHACMQVSM